MDMQALGDDLDKTLRLLPRPLVEKLFSVVGAFKNDLGNLFPQLLPLLLPHAMAALPEWAAQCLDTDELGTTVMDVFQSYLNEGTSKVSIGMGDARSEAVTPVILQDAVPANNSGTNG